MDITVEEVIAEVRRNHGPDPAEWIRLSDLCRIEAEISMAGFHARVGEFIATEAGLRGLAEYFECSYAVVRSWAASGNPHPRIRDMVDAFIRSHPRVPTVGTR